MVDLAAKVAAFLVEHPGEWGVDDIAKGIGKRRAAVAEVLAGDGRFTSRETAGRRGNKREVWRLALVAVPELGRASSGTPRRASQCSKLLALLSADLSPNAGGELVGEWITTKVLNKRVPGRTNSRMDELRQRGKRSGMYRIEHEGVGFGPEFHKYRVIWLAHSSTAPLKAAA